MPGRALLASAVTTRAPRCVIHVAHMAPSERKRLIGVRMTDSAHRELKLASALSGKPIGDTVAALARREVASKIGATSRRTRKR
jgi:hypothetical protein